MSNTLQICECCHMRGQEWPLDNATDVLQAPDQTAITVGMRGRFQLFAVHHNALEYFSSAINDETQRKLHLMMPWQVEKIVKDGTRRLLHRFRTNMPFVAKSCLFWCSCAPPKFLLYARERNCTGTYVNLKELRVIFWQLAKDYNTECVQGLHASAGVRRDPVSSGHIFHRPRMQPLHSTNQRGQHVEKYAFINKRFRRLYLQNLPKLCSRHPFLHRPEVSISRSGLSKAERELSQKLDTYVQENIISQTNARLLQRDIRQDFEQTMHCPIPSRSLNLLTSVLTSKGAYKYNGRDGSRRPEIAGNKSSKGLVFKHVTFRDGTKAPWNCLSTADTECIMSIENLLN